jgi:hypothetical protein
MAFQPLIETVKAASIALFHAIDVKEDFTISMFIIPNHAPATKSYKSPYLSIAYR